jgi:hypothetical protein
LKASACEDEARGERQWDGGNRDLHVFPYLALPANNKQSFFWTKFLLDKKIIEKIGSFCFSSVNSSNFANFLEKFANFAISQNSNKNPACKGETTRIM